jgi:uncharacterized protein
MEPGNQNQEEVTPAPSVSDPPQAGDTGERQHDLLWVLLGEHGLRTGWSVAIFVGLYYLLIAFLDTIALAVYPGLAQSGFSPVLVLIGELLPFSAILAATLFMTRVEQRTLGDYNLRDPQGLRHFSSGFAAGSAALSALVLTMALGGWLEFGRVALSGAHALKYGCIWAAAFLLVGFCEEGVFRCYLLATLTRGVSFWWALAVVAGLCLLVMLKSAPHGASGVYTVALLGVVPCWLLERARSGNAGFWQAAWVTSTAFGFYHTDNIGETWVGIFAASLIGFIFCASVRLTGSAWWAIGCHMAWDWTETYFYGTADSGLVAKGHLLTTTVHGNALWSGGSDGPEGSLLVLPATMLLLALLVLVYGRRKPAELRAQSTEPLAS